MRLQLVDVLNSRWGHSLTVIGLTVIGLTVIGAHRDWGTPSKGSNIPTTIPTTVILQPVK